MFQGELTPILEFQSTPSVGRATRNICFTVFCFMDFNPRPPWGGRQTDLSSFYYNRHISIHALRGEGDRMFQGELTPILEFQSTPSVGRATNVYQAFTGLISTFQSTPSVGRATACKDY